ncbi:DUF6221 family protein [Streptomyces sp. NPDC005303]|uniref:DUF6221 family protein n=1 Tax=Streptomyces sp. NPDC005303 TaxID=3155713 RepID=UPI0033B226EF
MDDLIVFLRAQLDEDERSARRAGDSFRQIGETGVIVATEGDRAEECASANWAGVAEHIVEHDPARVLRDIEVDRELLAEYQRLLRAHQAHQKEASRMTREHDDDPTRRAALRREADYLPAMLHVVERWAKRKAAVYDGRPGYLEAWRP